MSDVVSVAEAALLARDQEAQPWKQAFVCLLDGPLSREQLIDRITDRLDYAPRFRRKPTGWPVAAWADDPAFVVSGHVREHSLPPDRPLQDWLAERLATPFDHGHPLWEAWLVHGAVRSLPALVVFSHPALVDGYDNVHLLQELFDEQPAPITPPARTWRPGSAAEPGLGDLLGRLGDPLRVLQDAGAGLTGLVENAVRSAGAAPRPHHVAGVEVDLATLRRVRESFGCSTHDVLLTLVTAGVRGWLVDHGRPPEDVVALVPLAVEEPDVLGSAIGARIAPQWIALPVSEISPQARLRDIATLTRARLDTGMSVPATELRDLAGFALPTLHSLAAATVAAGRPHTVFVANAPGPAARRYLGPARVTGVYGLIATTDEQECTVSISSYAGRVTIGITAVREVRHFARDVSNELGALRAGE
ncbi:MAG: wax ester/triacylglycerol synthase family O-acyltransferase [Propionicimonas sp.]|uniref:wax ester/triacylglycerol synthase domain-containing protein n=1 Tax=Propionicimonas sp. TaxID=1955623 RepID=UPI002B1F9EE5|nr:wax ester/triacylglycerol synthase domain-containing protein [Propionicimonas sp.]MEA4944700.1 wax ester/triacylglycerol synthase family O-acyltransferase [Propionicimonas sp.]MEA5055328.1 wax ester/triacylglycerol synthase family O-acyltransferase [Propionicimonas sp.]MEA5118826.1 wax ester/triacylglycerol synthase family O-acyltransferase [Propionicimonas sp.]